MSDFLEEVAARTRRRVEAEKRQIGADQLNGAAKRAEPARSLRRALRHPGRVTVIAELKQASPSSGVIRRENDIPGRIRAYTQGGAAALSILTEEDYFHGSPQMLETARRVCALPLLRKDFIIDPYQIVESRSLGADALLLIASLLPGALLRDFIFRAQDLGMEALVEAHEERDLDHALESQAMLLGINNRNLHTLRVDVSTAERLLSRLPKGGTSAVVVESGIKDPAELPRLRDLGAHAVLIGETLMRSFDPEAAVRAFVQATASPKEKPLKGQATKG